MRVVACASVPRPARRCRNRSATPGRRASASTSSTASARPRLLHIFLSNAPGDIDYGTRGVRCRATRCGWSTKTASTSPMARSAKCWCTAPSAGEGYWNQRSKSRSTFEGDWTRTGDKYIRDAEGRYTFCGRSDDMFKVSGIWVSPFEVESALITHPAVLEAAVVPEADPEGLLKPKAFVVLQRRARKTEGLHRGAARSTSSRRSARGNIRAGSMWSRACRRRRRGKSSGSSCGMGHRNPRPVVPANAGTHTPQRFSCLREGVEPSVNTRAAAYGSRLRRDDEPEKPSGSLGKHDSCNPNPTGFLRIGTADLEYRMIGPSPERGADHRDAARRPRLRRAVG